jgi:hypothetical protein
MCPVCVANAALIVGSTVSTGGLTALGVKVLRWKIGLKGNGFSKWIHQRRKNHGDGDRQVGCKSSAPR